MRRVVPSVRTRARDCGSLNAPVPTAPLPLTVSRSSCCRPREATVTVTNKDTLEALSIRPTARDGTFSCLRCARVRNDVLIEAGGFSADHPSGDLVTVCDDDGEVG